MKFPAAPGSDDEPGYDFDGIQRDHLTPGGMYKEQASGGARMENVKVCARSCLCVCVPRRRRRWALFI